MRVEIDHLLAQFPIESGHDRNYKDQHRHAEHHTNDRDQCDDREKCALRFQIPQRQEKTKRKLQLPLGWRQTQSDSTAAGLESLLGLCYRVCL